MGGSMKTRLIGVHKVNKTLVDGSVATYYYAWRGGPRITSKPGTNAFTVEFARLMRGRAELVSSSKNSLGDLIAQYTASGDFQSLKPNTKRGNERSLGLLKAEFANLPISAIEARGSRKLFLAWRDTMKETPAAADFHLSVLAKIFAWAKDKEIILRHPLEKFHRLHDGGNHKDAIWMPSQLNTILTKGTPHLVDVVKVALWTMQRQGDVLTMPTIAYDGGRLWITQGKTNQRVRVRPPEEIMPIIERAIAKKQQRILVNSHGDNWSSDGFRASFNLEKHRLGITGVRFHDLRGTGISYAYAYGMDIEHIAEISGHSRGECERIIRRHYLAGSDIIDAIRSGTKQQ